MIGFALGVKDGIALGLFILLSLFAAVCVRGQGVQQAPPVKLLPQAPPVKESKYLSFARAGNNYPIVVFVGIDPREIAGVQPCYEPIGFADSQKPCVIVFANKGNGMRYPPTMTDSEIRRAAGLEVTPRAVPFRRLRLGEVKIADDSEDISGRLMQAWARIIKLPEIGLLIQQRPDGFHIMSEQDLGGDPGAFETLEAAQVAAQTLAIQFASTEIRRRD